MDRPGTAPLVEVLLRFTGCLDVQNFNDTHTHDEVMKLFDRAIELAKEKA